jgi:hypothetical protein
MKKLLKSTKFMKNLFLIFEKCVSGGMDLKTW